MEENHDKKLFDELSVLYEKSTGEKLPEARMYGRGEEIYTEGKMPRGVYYIEYGTVRISHNNHDSPVTVRIARDNELIGYLALIKHWDYTTTATAVEPSKIRFIPRPLFLKSIETNIQFANIVLDILCNCLNDRNKSITDAVSKNVQQRLCILLLALDRSPTDGKIQFYKTDIASMLNIQAETLSRNLKHLEKQDTVKLNSQTNTIEILSREKLLRCADITD